ncbi:hypothetical protein [Phenylobacterium sp.]|uniref:hypothetical protein n=1 Tax=Phenylobacterium sp. TaxID=1871053 RepID=UPI002E35AE87|nr:hypothetical protein [Phenylobacterium sp.]HEX4712597.1 hypothetical protein [Phenylobacterium sp.]
MLTNFVDVASDGLSIGMKVKVKFQSTEGGPPAPVFAPAQPGAASTQLSSTTTDI